MLLLVDIATVHLHSGSNDAGSSVPTLQLTLVLALLPSCRARMNDEVIRRVHDSLADW
jgi:hypothetical protein